MSDPGPMTGAELLDLCQATEHERRLVASCVEEVRKHESAMIRRYSREVVGRGYTKTGGPERVLSRAGVHWRRQVPLLSAAVALARESGLYLGYTTDGALRRKILAGAFSEAREG